MFLYLLFLSTCIRIDVPVKKKNNDNILNSQKQYHTFDQNWTVYQTTPCHITSSCRRWRKDACSNRSFEWNVRVKMRGIWWERWKLLSIKYTKRFKNKIIIIIFTLCSKQTWTKKRNETKRKINSFSYNNNNKEE